MRGSRKHVLEWSGSSTFATDLIAMAAPVSCSLRPDSKWMPRGSSAPSEARLDRFGDEAMPGHPAWPVVREWWLKHKRGANTPNWDVALSCSVVGTAGFILGEAKANEPELSDAGKWEWKEGCQGNPPSARSLENRLHIAKAIDEARLAINQQFPGSTMAISKSYQLSNRIAFAWKLASLGIPIVLIYLGFTGDSDIADVGRPFATSDDWHNHFKTHLNKICPGLPLDAEIQTDRASFWVLSRTRAA